MAQRTIGPTFGAELAAASLAGLPFSWGSDGSFYFAESITQEQQDAIRAVYEAHDPARVPPALTPAEKLAAAGLTAQDLFDLLGL